VALHPGQPNGVDEQLSIDAHGTDTILGDAGWSLLEEAQVPLSP